MRLLTIAAYTVAFLFALHANAQSVKQVEVVNLSDPQNVIGTVDVTNLPDIQDVNVVGGATSTCDFRRFQLVGFTSTFYTGNMGGVLGTTQKCQLDFPGSRMCALADIQGSTSLPSQFAELAWIEPLEGYCADTVIINNRTVTLPWSCGDASRPCSLYAPVIEATGSLTVIAQCSTDLPIACCAPMP